MTLSNNYVSSTGKKRIRSQIETYNYLRNKIQRQAEITAEPEELKEIRAIAYST